MDKNAARFLVVNFGSSSEKFALYEGEKEVWGEYFEEAAGKFAKVKENLAGPLDGVLMRVVAAGEYFSRHHVVDERTLIELEKARVTNPLHVPKVELGIKEVQAAFPGVPIFLMSDAEFLSKASRRDSNYALPAEFGFKRWGAHGLSYGYVMSRVKKWGLLAPKMVVCHLGSGCSVTGFIDGEPAYTSMGETPLEGLVSATRAGSVDPTIGALLGAEKGAEAAIKILNEEAGLLAVTGTGHLREVIERREAGDAAAAAAFEMFVDSVAGKIGELAAKMGGCDVLVFTATIGVRSVPARQAIVAKLKFMGFEICDIEVAETTEWENVAAEGSKPIYVIPTNEALYMVEKASELENELEE